MLLVQYYHFAIACYFFEFSTLSLNVTCAGSSPDHSSLHYVIVFPVSLQTKSDQFRLFNCSVCLNI
jgi:hypothetical protein